MRRSVRALRLQSGVVEMAGKPVKDSQPRDQRDSRRPTELRQRAALLCLRLECSTSGVEEPRAPLRLIDPILDQARGRDIAMFVA
jgi:hypothetical protein